jgi:hypothetical protein
MAKDKRFTIKGKWSKRSLYREYQQINQWVAMLLLKTSIF